MTGFTLRSILLASACLAVPTGAWAQSSSTVAAATVSAGDKGAISAPQTNTIPQAPASPQLPPGSDSGQSDVGLADIVVTAQRRSERVQNVPITITALPAAALEAAGIRSLQDLPLLAPGLVLPMSRNTATPYLRGVGSQQGTAGVEGAVAVYLDGVYLPAAISNVFTLNNIERIEVLKGPQGTLFGRNATGGLIQVITRDPSHTQEISGFVGYGNYNTLSGAIYATGELASAITANIAVNVSHQGDGWGKNFFRGLDVNRARSWSVRSKVKFELGTNSSLLLSADYNRFQSDLGNVRQPLPGTVAGVLAVGGVPASNQLFTAVGTIYDVSSRLVGTDDIPYGYQWGGSAVFNHELGKNITFTSTTAYRRLRVTSLNDTDGTPAIGSDAQFIEIGKSFQQEFLLNGKSGKLDWTAGLFYFHAENGFESLRISAVVPGPQNQLITGLVTTDSYAAFGQATYEILPKTRLTVGFRYTSDRRDITGQTLARVGNTAPVGTVLASSAALPESVRNRKWNAPTWRVALDHRFSSNVMVYASYNRGFKSGSFNSSSPGAAAVEPEYIDAFEVGLKSDLFEKTVRINLAAFYYNYRNLQLNRITGGSSVNFNAPSQKPRGAEAEITWAPPVATGRLTFNLSATYLRARYENFPNAPLTVPRAATLGGNVTVAADASGHFMVRAPEFTGNASVDYAVEVSNNRTVSANVSFLHTDKFYWEPDNRIVQPGYNLVNAQIGFGPTDGRWKLSVWGSNITNTKYFASVVSSPFSDGAIPGAPRTYGVKVQFKF
jgi:iron complex outermembrane receptor protein